MQGDSANMSARFRDNMEQLIFHDTQLSRFHLGANIFREWIVGNDERVGVIKIS